MNPPPRPVRPIVEHLADERRIMPIDTISHPFRNPTARRPDPTLEPAVAEAERPVPAMIRCISAPAHKLALPERALPGASA